ncbi:histone-lysine N-methyltransferase, H3 lysine-9 specific SUVH4 isoform X1 [Cucurbita moschata]|nr:histone-lysine N-methyltransferase, H3 lysine-9 specific SUVH4 isoform X1 [Cucurbita moschata]XP_022934520.1 histone-lysine N-methyltransferase, H3 lysine-9 specific SUVH4 isoform X1 [Cucurbita moschata]XP_022934521.1 histone-lysine N-methyltransferase, H3 lysine-9 specific SUVH4 isoform X1 [Cucurbita moschata]
MVVKSRVLHSAVNGELHSPVTPEEKPKSHKVATHGRKNAKAAKPEGDAEEPSPSPQRRTSARIQLKQLAEKKELLARQRVEVLDEPESASKRKKTNGQVKSKRNTTPSVAEEVVEDKAVAVPVSNDVAESKDGDASEPLELCASEKSRTGDEGGPANIVEKSDHAKVKETLRLFNKYYLHFVQEEEKRCKKAEVAQKASKRSKSEEAPAEDTKHKSKRPDLKAVSKMLEANEILNHEKRIGNVPGINIGHRFYSRAEMVAVGFHSHWLNGIDYMGLSYSKMYSNYSFPLAVAIVLSGMYEDDLDNAEDVIYTGQGGQNLTGNKRQIRDQVMERGNLALKNCIEQAVPVRVVRGHECASSYCGKLYTYDGLYKVIQYWAEKGISGFTVFKFRLRRIEGQSLLTTNQVQFVYGRVPKSVAEIRGLVCEDITGGQEDIPIPATNLVDDPPVAPIGFTYCKSIKVAHGVKLPSNANGCDCIGSCIDSRTCSCAKLNGLDFPYVHRDGGRLIEAKDVVYECGPNCGCGPGCVNRTSQRGIKYRLEVFRTPKKGWAVRSWDFIPSGAPVCEYTGILTRTEDLDHVSENNYIFEIDCLQTISGIGGRERRSRDASLPANNSSDGIDDQRSESVPEFCIDACSTGNIARFINHSCEPNLFVQCVLSSHHDIKLARVVLFAAENIPPLQELTYDYGYALDSVYGPDGKIIQMPCFCGATECRKRLF